MKNKKTIKQNKIIAITLLICTMFIMIAFIGAYEINLQNIETIQEQQDDIEHLEQTNQMLNRQLWKQTFYTQYLKQTIQKGITPIQPNK